MIRMTQIILRIKTPSNVKSDRDINDFPDILRKNIFIILSNISCELDHNESKEFYASPDTIKQIALSVSSLKLCVYRSDVAIHCFNDVPNHVAKI